MKKILIAIPTNTLIEPETFKSIYDLTIPEGYETEFQFFYGYSVSQVRNLIANWAQSWDYLFAIDHDMVFPKDTLEKLLLPDLDIIGGIYRQRTNELNLEVYNFDLSRTSIDDIKSINEPILQVGALGFGCILVKSEVFRTMQYPWFVYYEALDHKDTFSEDLDFCVKARNAGYKIYARKDIEIKHIGKYYYTLPDINSNSVQIRLKELANQDLLPIEHVDYLNKIKFEDYVSPNVIYDIGSCVLHWTSKAKKVWPDASYYLFEAMDDVKFLYDEEGWDYNLGLLGEYDNEVKSFNQNTYHPGGNSVYDENEQYSPRAKEFFPKENKINKVSMSLDTIVESRNFMLPDLIKLDIQGSELSVLKGASKCLEHCSDIILEAQEVDYNIGAPKFKEIKEYLESKDFRLVQKITNSSPLAVDADYHFSKFRTL